MKYADNVFGVSQRLHRPEDFEGTGVGPVWLVVNEPSPPIAFQLN